MPTNNSINTVLGASGTVLTSTGTTTPPTFQTLPAGVTVTQYDALSGGSSNTLVSFGPGTAGQVYQSAGAGANPVYSTSTYPSTNSAGDLIYGSGSNTLGNLSVNTRYGAPVGSDGSNPVYLTPMQYIYLIDDFIWSPTGAGGTLGWATTGSFSVVNGVTAANPGVVRFTASSSTAYSLNNGTGNNGNILLGGGFISCTWYFKLITLSNGTNRYTVRAGIMDKISTSAVPGSGVWFEYSDNLNSGNWTINACSNTSLTQANSSTAADTNYHRFRIDVNAAASSVAFYIDDVQLGNSPLSTNIPTANAISPSIAMYLVLGAGLTMDIDFFTYYQKLTTLR